MPQLRRWRTGWNNEVAMRLNLFLPFPEKSKKRTIARSTLRRIGVTWLYSPARRVSQMVCVILFLFLFFYVCWPYGSRDYAKAFQAKEVLEQLLIPFPGNILTLLNLAEAQFRRGMTQSAIQLARAAAAGDEGSFARDKITAMKLLVRISRAGGMDAAARDYERRLKKLQ